METKSNLVKRNDNKTLKENGAKEVLAGVLKLAGDKLSKHERLIVEEFLINGKTFADIKEVHWIVPSLQKRWFNNGLKKLNYILNTVEVRLTECEQENSEFEKEFDKIKAENANLKYEVEKLRVKLQVRSDLPKEMIEFLTMPIEKLNFSSRLQNVFKARDIDSVGDLVQLREKDFSSTRNVGKSSMEEIREFFNRYSLTWNMDI